MCFYNFMSRSSPKKSSKVSTMLTALNSLSQLHSWASKTSEPPRLPHTYTPYKKVDDTQGEYKGKSNGWSKSDEGKRQNPGCRRLNGKKEGRREKGKKRGRHLFHITAFNLSQVVKLADNTDSFAKVLDEESHTTDTRISALHLCGMVDRSGDMRRDVGI